MLSVNDRKPVDIRISFLYTTTFNEREPMTTEPITAAITDLDPAYIVRTERQGQVISVSVPVSQGEAEIILRDFNERRAARLKRSSDPWDHVPQRYFICRIQYEEV